MASILALWVLVIFETVLLVLLLRALGELRQRGGISTQASTDREGLSLGTQAPVFVATDHEGTPVGLEDTDRQWRILAFIAPGCSACEFAIHALNDFIAEQQNIAVLVIGDANLKENRAYAAEKQAVMPILTTQPNVVKELYLVRSVPFAYVLDANGIIRAKGRINEKEHIHYLLAEAKAPVLVTQTR